MIDPVHLKEELKPILKNLIKDTLLKNLYSEHSQLIEKLLFRAIAEFVKVDLRIKNYTELANIVIKEFTDGLIRKEGEIEAYPEDRVLIQLNLLRSIVSQCHTRKDMRVKFLGESFMVDLVSLVEFIVRTQDSSEQRDKIVESGLFIICVMMPNKKKEDCDRSKQIVAVLSLLLRITERLRQMKGNQRKTAEGLIIQAITKAMRHRSPQIESMCT